VSWRRLGRSLWACVPPADDLAQDGAMVIVSRTDVLARQCPTCGRRQRLWQVDVELPKPFPVLGPVGAGCTRSWAEVAGSYAVLADTVRSRDPYTEWDARHADMRARQAARAAWLADRDGQDRRLALRLWSSAPRLDLETTELVVASVLSGPVHLMGTE
jgi:hypothetical protein